MVSTKDETTRSIKAIDSFSTHRIASGQVVIDLQTAVKELVENSLDAGATNIEVRFKECGLESIEVIDNGSGIASADYDAIGLKHHTSKLSSFEDLERVSTFGFRGEALSSLCATCSSVTITTATERDTPMGTILHLDKQGRVTSKDGKTARQKGTTVCLAELFKPLPVRRKELERNAKREFGKALNILGAYALLPCAVENGGVRLTCTHQPNGGRKVVQFRTDGTTSIRASVSALWGSKALENLVDLDLAFDVETEKSVLRRQGLLPSDKRINRVVVRGLISKFALNCGRSGPDRQFFYINGRPCHPSKVQRAFNDVYKTFNVAQSPIIIANFVLPKDSLDINVSPDKRTIFIHSEESLVQALKGALEEQFSPERSTYHVADTPLQADTAPPSQKSALTREVPSASKVHVEEPLFINDDEESDPMSTNESSATNETGLEQGTLVSKGSTEIPREVIPTSPSSVDDCHSLEAPLHSTGTSDTTVPMHTETQNSSSPPVPEKVVDSGSSRPPTQLDAHAALSDTPGITHIFISAKSSSVKNSMSIKEARAPRVSSSAAASRSELVLNSTRAFRDSQAASPEGEASDDRPRKRQRLELASHTPVDHPARLDLKSKITNYAMQGSRTAKIVNEPVAEGLQNEGDDPKDRGEETRSNTERVEPLVRPSSDVTAHVENFLMDEDVTYSPPSNQENISLALDCAAPIPRQGAEVESRERGQAAHSRKLGADSRSTPEYVRTSTLESSVLRCDLEAISRRWELVSMVSISSSEPEPLASNIRAALDDDDCAAAEVLSRVIKKHDFAQMEAVGQFNLGFIIVRRRAQGQMHDTSDADSTRPQRSYSALDDLFIVDQHAADEKYNFEQLQENTRIDSQPLFRPKPLELTAADELLAIQHLDVLRQNGFEIHQSELPQTGHRLQLVSQPISKSTVFDMRDLEELLHKLQDSAPGQMVRCSKARSMFAMRACRMSIMVGMPLKYQQMTSVIRHMGTMDQPWNCPHGRPTMRHLADIAQAGRKRPQNKPVAWESFITGA